MVQVLSPFLSHPARQAENKIGSPTSFFISFSLTPYIGFPPGGGVGWGGGADSVKHWKIKINTAINVSISDYC